MEMGRRFRALRSRIAGYGDAAGAVLCPLLGPCFGPLRFHPLAIGLSSHDEFPPVFVVVRADTVFVAAVSARLI